MQENARLKAEVDELKSQPDPLTAYLYAAELAKDDIKKLKAENAYLKSEVDRLKNNVAYLDRTLDDHLDKAIGNALMRERLEAMKRLDAIRRMKDKADPLTDQQG
jgi:cell division protein FtsB